MQTCEEHDHCIVVYESKNCPVCDKIDNFEQEIFNRDEKIEELEVKLEEQ